ncbi:MAG TPA: alpha/beta fold hydrolase [Dehalococcoidia bacterium]|nr:alpha/beta fold hydrolase [Dehalococcoidia bacterium]
MAEAQELAIASVRGPVRALFHPPAENGAVVVCVGGFDGGFDGPADGLFPALAEDLAPHGIGVLRVDFRDRRAPGIVANGATDVLAAVEEMKRRGVRRFGLVGHSFGGAVMIRVGAFTPEVKTVVTLSTQTAGALDAPKLAPRSILLIHGLDDVRLPPDCSRYIYAIAKEPKRLVLLPGARHSLRQAAGDVRRLVGEWLITELK